MYMYKQYKGFEKKSVALLYFFLVNIHLPLYIVMLVSTYNINICLIVLIINLDIACL